ncbi:DNA-(apurinic or apyrimidinic site) lyase [Mycena kentingensis (nom. inval.)]|nr:DNA-(apurinic or apyrimidinic site) lyase [Mycena kentingensis (nom. inval.)]
MRILTWNINGIRTIPQYHPWNTFKTHEEILDHLKADIICFQEVKSSRQNLPKAVGAPPNWASFFSFPHRKAGYSGVAVYAHSAVATPLKAEEGLTGLLQPNPPLSALERVSAREAYPSERTACDDLDLRSLDAEGRALIVDFGLFVLVNVYCPNDGTETDERLQYKKDFHTMLEARIRGLIEVDRREVILLGDLNACAAVIDHVEGPVMIARAQAEGIEGEEGFWLTGARQWLKDLLVTEASRKGCLVDIVRRFHPERKGMYTCWNTRISARDGNYGTRIDYILVTPGLVRWIKAADIQPELKGSDHCPVFLDFNEVILDEDGRELRLSDVLVGGSEIDPELPRIATKYWDEYKQRLLSTFFTSKVNPPVTTPGTSIQRKPTPPTQPPTPRVILSQPEATKRKEAPATSSNSQPPPKKAKADTSASKVKPSIKGQSSLAAFFAKPSAKPGSSRIDAKGKGKAQEEPMEIVILDSPEASPTRPLASSPDLDADYRLALSLSQELPESPTRATDPARNAKARAWGRMLAPPAPPRCTVHNEPAKSLTVTKAGPNKGKKFFICSRPVGPGYDAGKDKRRRNEVNDEYRCDFFKWASDARKEELAKKNETD